MQAELPHCTLVPEASLSKDITEEAQEAAVGKPRPMELRTRVVEFVEERHSHREAVRCFMV